MSSWYDNNDTFLLDIFFERHPTGKSVEKSVEEIKDCLDRVNETFEKEKEENMRQVRVRDDQIKDHIVDVEELKNSQEFTKTILEENMESIDNKLRAEMTEMHFNMKSLEVKIEQNFEKNIESSNNVAQTVQELDKSQSENLQSLKSEISIKLKESDEQNRSLIENIEKRFTMDTEKKLTQLGRERKSIMINVVMIIISFYLISCLNDILQVKVLRRA